MDFFPEDYIKQEPNSNEQEFISVLPLPQRLEAVTNTISVEHETLVPEDTHTEGFINNAMPVFSEYNKNIATKAVVVNNFVVYEFEEPQQKLNSNKPMIQNLEQPLSRLLNKSNKRTTQRMPVTSVHISATAVEPKILNLKAKTKSNKTISPESSIAEGETSTIKHPIVLNSRLGKRSSHGLQATANKKPWNNSNGKSSQAKIFSTKSPKLQSNENKKIINYSFKKNRVERFKKNLLSQESTKDYNSEYDLAGPINVPNTFTSIIASDEKNVSTVSIKSEILGDGDEYINENVPVESLTLSFSNAPTPTVALVCIDKKVQQKESNTFNTTNIKFDNATDNASENTPVRGETNAVPTPSNASGCVDKKEDHLLKSTTFDLSNKIQMSNISPLPSIPCKPLSAIQNEKLPTFDVPAPTKEPCEIKVKCLCRLTTEKLSDDEQSSCAKEDLKAFFDQMFQETRRLSKQQQRAIKISLLQAINEAEEMAEKGKCCCF